MQAQYETVISKRNLERIHSRSMSPAELIAFLEEGALYRSFADVLRSVSPGEGLAERLKTRLLGKDGQPTGPNAAKALRKTVTNRLRGEAAPLNREQLFKICFALELDEARAQCRVHLTAPVPAGDVVIPNVLGTGVDVVATLSV